MNPTISNESTHRGGDKEKCQSTFEGNAWLSTLGPEKQKSHGVSVDPLGLVHAAPRLQGP